LTHLQEIVVLVVFNSSLVVVLVVFNSSFSSSFHSAALKAAFIYENRALKGTVSRDGG
jgi:hypothetical protein